jgi:hypothetical protein
MPQNQKAVDTGSRTKLGGNGRKKLPSGSGQQFADPVQVQFRIRHNPPIDAMNVPA